jgi:hypothetical protein
MSQTHIVAVRFLLHATVLSTALSSFLVNIFMKEPGNEGNETNFPTLDLSY